MDIWIQDAGGDPIIDSNGDIAHCADCPCDGEVDCTPCCECHYFTFSFDDGTNTVTVSIKITPTNVENDCCCEYSVAGQALPGGGTLDFTGKMVRDLFFFTISVNASTAGTFSLPWQTVEALWSNCCGQMQQDCGHSAGPTLCVEPQTYTVCADDNDEVTVNMEVYPFCTDCVDNDPEICLTVFDADYAGGNINWAGLVWTPAEVQAGATKTACPTSYTKTTFPQTPSGSGAVHRWAWSTGGGPDLMVGRSVSVSAFGSLIQRNNTARLFGFGSPYSINYYIDTGFGPPITGTSGGFSATSPFAPPSVKGVAFPSVGAYLVTDAFFGSHTISGVTYTWERGRGWP
jgi:hypothetical protein